MALNTSIDLRSYQRAIAFEASSLATLVTTVGFLRVSSPVLGDLTGVVVGSHPKLVRLP